jgi:transglutaminase-like putative cysteine protease
MKRSTILVLCSIALTSHAQQTPSVKFGKINAADLQQKVYNIDSSASAVILYESGSSAVEGNTKGWFSLTYKKYKRIHILKKSGYDEADIEIPLYTSGNDEEELNSLRAVTYNLEGGTIVETKLSKENVFKEKRSKNLVVKKFTLPNVKEGCIIEYEYKVKSDFLHHVEPWSFQGSKPRLWSEYRLSVPQFLNYVFLSQGYRSFTIKDQKDHIETFKLRDDGGTRASESTTFTSGVTDYRWAMQDVPELKHESFTSTLRNHVARIEFQLASYQYPLQPHDFMGTWPGLTKELLESDYFGSALKGGNGWLSDVVKPLLAGTKTPEEKARNIYSYVRDNITCTDHSALYTDKSLKSVLKEKSGNVSEVNLLLTAMLRYADLAADPVILSTSDHGYVYDMYPLRERFNYVIARTTIGNTPYMLDATHPRLGFGKLAADCYNGYARIVNEDATALALVADSLKERKITSVLVNNINGTWTGNFNQVSGYYESLNIRDKIKEAGQEAFFKEVKKAYGLDVTIKDPVVDSLNQFELPVATHYTFDANFGDDDILYINPMFGEGYRENPFKSAQRSYPVEMPYATDETYNLSFFVPEGYEVDELPKQTAVKLNEAGDGYFEYLISHSGNIISMRSRIKLQRTYYAPDEYELMREFFALVVNKHNEQIVLKKKKTTP